MHERPPAWSGQCIPSALGNERVCSCLHTDEWDLLQSCHKPECKGVCPLWVKSRHLQLQCSTPCLLWAKSGLIQLSKKACYSITSSAATSSPWGTVMLSALAVLMLITRSNLLGCSTGMSAGFVLRRTLSTKSAARRNSSSVLGP